MSIYPRKTGNKITKPKKSFLCILCASMIIPILLFAIQAPTNKLGQLKKTTKHNKREEMLNAKGYWTAAKIKQQYKDSVEREKRVQWWRNARFGIFVHWGVYSVLGGEYNGIDYGKEAGGPSAEWIFKKAKIPKEEYRKIAKNWNPKNYNPEIWCKLAKEAGAGYIVLTAKHHDGFALFDDKGATNWNSVKNTDYHDDLLKKFVNAAKKAGLKVGIYYSHRLDWWHIGLNKTDNLPDNYIKILRSHLKTIMQNYKPDLMWFDMGKAGQAADIAYEITREYNPNCVICGRIGGKYGDYSCLKDRQLPPIGNTIDCETPMTMRLNWGYDKNDNNWKTPREIIKMLSLCSTRNTNFLLNIGPKPDGSLSQEEISCLKELGRWMKNNSESIKNTNGSPLQKEYPWGGLSISHDKKTLYIHIQKIPENGKITIEGLNGDFISAEFLQNHTPIKFSYDSKTNKIELIFKPAKLDFVDIIKLKSKEKILSL